MTKIPTKKERDLGKDPWGKPWPDENRGDWVLLAVLPMARKTGPARHAVPVMEPKNKVVMHLFHTADEAAAHSALNSAMRVGGGWAVNIKTGETVRIPPDKKDLRHV